MFLASGQQNFFVPFLHLKYYFLLFFENIAKLRKNKKKEKVLLKRLKWTVCVVSC